MSALRPATPTAAATPSKNRLPGADVNPYLALAASVPCLVVGAWMVVVGLADVGEFLWDVLVVFGILFVSAGIAIVGALVG